MDWWSINARQETSRASNAVSPDTSLCERAMSDLILSYMTIGLVNGSFYAMLCLGLALIFGLLNILNMAHGVFYMMGAFIAWAAVTRLGVGYLPTLAASAFGVGGFGMLVERLLLRRTYDLDPLYGFMLTFGLATAIQGAFQVQFGSSGLPFEAPGWLSGLIDLRFTLFPAYRLWVVLVALAVCFGLWLAIERTKAGAILRAASENGVIAASLGVRVPAVMTVTFGIGAMLAGLAGALAAPIYQVSPLMGADILLVVFAIIVIGGMGSIGGTILAAYCLALLESVTLAVYPQAANFMIFAFMCIVLSVRPQGLFGISVLRDHSFAGVSLPAIAEWSTETRSQMTRFAVMGMIIVGLALLPKLLYTIFLIKIFCFAILATSFNFLLGFVGIISFGQAALYGTAAYVTAYTLKQWSAPPEIGILAGVAAATLLGLIMGALAIRRRGIYQAMITLAVAQMVYFVFIQTSFTNGEDGLQNVPRGVLFGLVDLRDDRAVYALAVIAFCAVFFGLRHLLYSQLGMMLVAVRDDERRALSLGHDVASLKLLAFTIASACAGLAGALSAVAFQLATLSGAHWHLSGEAVLMSLIGGLGTLTGPLAGATVLVAMEHFLAPFGAWVLVLQGLIFVICVVAFREGLIRRGVATWTRHVRHRLLTPLVAAQPIKEGGKS
jgi:branched-chain amino acid transport system permease protein